MSDKLAALTDVAKRAAAVARTARPTLVEQKRPHDFVTDMDRRLETDIRTALASIFPGVSALGEESLGDADRMPERVLLIDPLDGTSNWIAGLPFAAVSIAYLEDGHSELAVVASIDSGTVYTAERGKGAWRDRAPLNTPPPTAALMALSTGLLDAMADTAIFAALRRFGKLRNLGAQSLHLCAVAQGSLVFNASCEARLWDDAAGRLIATEAGARYKASIAQQDGSRPAARQNSLCSHPDIFDEVHAILEPLLHPTET